MTDWSRVEHYLKSNEDRFLHLFREMVGINSFTENGPGVNSLGELTASAFGEIGFDAHFNQSITPEFGRHLILTRPSNCLRTIGFISHLDTVYSPEDEREFNFLWREEGDRLYGPGTCDIKGGTIVAFMVLSAINHCLPALFDRFRFVTLLNAAEERAAPDFSELAIACLGDHCVAALVLELEVPLPETTTLVVGRKGVESFRVTVKGRESHSGANPEVGVSAIHELAHLIAAIAQLRDPNHGVSTNVGKIEGGTTINCVASSASAQFEFRAYDPAQFKATRDRIYEALAIRHERSLKDGTMCTVQVDPLAAFQPWAPNAATNKLFTLFQEVGLEGGYTVVSQLRGGASDGNNLWDKVPTIDGLGPKGGNPHCIEHNPPLGLEQEYALRSSLVQKALLNLRAIVRLSTQ